MPKPSKTGVRGLFKGASGRYFLDLRIRNPKTGADERISERLPEGATLAAAKVRAREILASAMAGTFQPKAAASRRLAGALDEYQKWRETNGRSNLEHSKVQCARIARMIGDLPLDEVSPFAVEKFKRERLAQKVKGGKRTVGPATVNRELEILRHFYNLAGRWGWVSKAHAASIAEVPRMKEPPGRVRYLTAEEETALFAQLKPELRRVVAAAVLTGMRESEIVTLRQDAVDLEARTITLIKTKSNKVRRIPISPALEVVLKEAIAHARAPMVFNSSRRTPYTADGLRASFTAARDRAKIANLHFHDLRHHFATTIRRRGAGLDVIAALLGHATLAMVQRYAHLTGDLLVQAVNSMPAPPAPAAKPASSKPAERSQPAGQIPALRLA